MIQSGKPESHISLMSWHINATGFLVPNVKMIIAQIAFRT